MDESIEVDDDVAVKIADGFGGKFSTNFFNFFDMIESIIFEEFLFE